MTEYGADVGLWIRIFNGFKRNDNFLVNRTVFVKI